MQYKIQLANIKLIANVKLTIANLKFIANVKLTIANLKFIANLKIHWQVEIIHYYKDVKTIL